VILSLASGEVRQFDRLCDELGRLPEPATDGGLRWRIGKVSDIPGWGDLGLCLSFKDSDGFGISLLGETVVLHLPPGAKATRQDSADAVVIGLSLNIAAGTEVLLKPLAGHFIEVNDHLVLPSPSTSCTISSAS
jgi:hypothetical protein